MKRCGAPIGTCEPRADARRLVTGAGTFVDDLEVPGVLHVAFVRSPYAHAAIMSINATAAVAMPGVVRIVTASDLTAICRPMQVKMPALAMMPGALQHPLAVGEVCWHGEPVVAVVARSRAEAEDAAERVEVDYEELPAVVDSEEALHPEVPDTVLGRSNLAFETVIGSDDITNFFSGDSTVVRQRLVFDRQTGVPLESRGIVAAYARGAGELVIHQSHQSPFQMRDVLCELLGLPNHKVRVICPDVGGAFGIKLHAYPDELAVAAIAVLLGRTVKFQADRLESFLSDAHAREAVSDARLAADPTGRFLAFEISAISGLGAYQSYPRGSVGEGLHMVQLVGAPYQFEAFRGHLRSVHQNKVPTGAYRGVGQPLACTVTESLVDEAARALGIDPAEIRRRNYLASERAVRRTPAELQIGPVSLTACLDKLLTLMRYDSLREEQKRLRRERIYRGVGIASFVELTGVGSGVYGANHIPVAAQEGCTVRLESSGTLLCHTSSTDQGQGSRTAIAQIVAQVLDVATSDITVRAGDTASSPVGGGTWASRGLAIGGQAALLAAEDLRRTVLDVAARVLAVPVERLELRDGVVHAGDGERLLSLGEIAALGYYRQHELPGGVCPELSATRHYVPTGFPYLAANGVQGCSVEVDVETGFIRLLGFWVAHDCGRVVNPMLVDEQIRGGVAQGIGGVLYERCEYSASGQLSNGTLADYLVPMAAELPDIEIAHVESVASETSLGAKGVGEAGTIGAGAALWNAVNDALHPLGAVMTRQPFTPDRVLRALDAATQLDSERTQELGAAECSAH